MAANKTYLRQFKSIISPHYHGEKFLINLLTTLKTETKTNPVFYTLSVLKSLTPGLKLVPQIRAGRVLHYPTYLTEKNAYFYAIKWLIEPARKLGTKMIFYKQIGSNMIDAIAKKGPSYRSKQELVNLLLQSRVLLKLQDTRKEGNVIRPDRPKNQKKSKPVSLFKKPLSPKPMKPAGKGNIKSKTLNNPTLKKK